MSFLPEPAFRHGQPDRTGVLLVNLGSPEAPTPTATRRYLAQFLSDPRVVEIPRLAWLPILHGIILRTRPAKSAAKYASIWTADGSPLVSGTRKLAALVQGHLGEAGLPVLVRYAMRYGQPDVAGQLNALREQGATRILVIPLYPQYAASTTASVFDAVAQWARQSRHVPEFRFLARYHDDPGYIAALAASVRQHWQAVGRSPMLVMSFHGLPHRSLMLGDPYHCECLKTGRLLAEALGLSKDSYRITFQSRFGRARWLEPYTEPTLKQLAAEGQRRVDVVCPGFAVDCLETLEEIAQEARDAFMASGGETFHYIPCLNDGVDHVRVISSIAQRHLQGWPLPGPESSPDRERSRERALAYGATD